MSSIVYVCEVNLSISGNRLSCNSYNKQHEHDCILVVIALEMLVCGSMDSLEVWSLRDAPRLEP